MRTVSAKELRDNLEVYVNLARRGESVEVTYRSKPAFTIQPNKTSAVPMPGTKLATRQFLKKAELLRSLAGSRVKSNKDRPDKKIYYQDMAKKYGLE